MRLRFFAMITLWITPGRIRGDHPGAPRGSAAVLSAEDRVDIDLIFEKLLLGISLQEVLQTKDRILGKRARTVLFRHVTLDLW